MTQNSAYHPQWIAAVVIPQFAVQLIRRAHAIPAHVPLALMRYGKRHATVMAASTDAQAVGVTLGQSHTRARSCCPSALFMPLDEERIQLGLNTLLKLLWEFSSRVETEEKSFPDVAVAYIDLGRLNTDALNTLLMHLEQDVSRGIGMQVQVGAAAGKLPAFLAAQTGQRQVIAPNGEMEFMHPQSIEYLPLSKKIHHRMTLLGIRTMGQLAALPKGAVIGQFGRGSCLLHTLASGLDRRPLVPRQMPIVERLREQYDPPLEDERDIADALAACAIILSRRLHERGMAAHTVTLTVHREKVKETERLHVVDPATNADRLEATFTTLLQRVPRQVGITHFEIELSTLVPALAQQLDLFGYKPARGQLVQLTASVAKRHRGIHFYTASVEESGALLYDQRCTFTLHPVEGNAPLEKHTDMPQVRPPTPARSVS